MKTLIALAAHQAQTRKQFESPIAEFGLVREKISQMTVDCFAAESAVWMVAPLHRFRVRGIIRWKRP